MADHNVLLCYGDNGLIPPEPIAIRRHQTISFRLDPGGNGRSIRITFERPELFSVSSFEEGDGDIVVTGTPVRTYYSCELLVNGVAVSSGEGSYGGEMVPDAGN